MPRRRVRAQFPWPVHGVSDDGLLCQYRAYFSRTTAEPRGYAPSIVIEAGSGRVVLCPSPAFMKKLRESCDLHGHCYCRRTEVAERRRAGPRTFFAMEQIGRSARPLTTFAQIDAGGFRRGRLRPRAELMDLLLPLVGLWVATYAGNPLGLRCLHWR